MSNNSNNNYQPRTSPRFSNSNYNSTEAGISESPIRPKKRSSVPTSSINMNSINYNLPLHAEIDGPEAVAAILAQNGDNSTQFHLQKLDLLYRNLEGRVSKLERFVSDQFFKTSPSAPAAIVGPVSESNVCGGFVLNNDFASISSSSSSTVATNNTNPSNFTNINSSSSSTLCSVSEPKEILKSDLDDYCLPLLQRRAAPSIGELNSVVMNLKKLKYPDLDNKFILSKVREWFRRKREYMSQRIFTICSKKFGHLINDPSIVVDLIDKARNNPIFIGEIVREANLEIVNEASAWEFCSDKVSSYLENYTANHGINY